MAGSNAAMFLAFREHVFRDGAAHMERLSMAEDEPGQDTHSPQDARLTSLDERLDRRMAEEARKSGQRASAESQRVIRSASTRIISVLIGYPLGGGVIGWTLDLWLQTLPWITLALMFLGFGLGFREVLRAAKRDPKPGQGVD